MAYKHPKSLEDLLKLFHEQNDLPKTIGHVTYSNDGWKEKVKELEKFVIVAFTKGHRYGIGKDN